MDKCLYAYIVKKGMHEVVAAFANEVDVGTPTNDDAQTMDNVVRQVPFVVSSSSPQRATFVTDFSHQIEQIPNMSQPRETRNEVENVEQTMNIEQIINTLDKAMLPVRDPSKKGLY
ncbi:hypothetical protein H5410_031059 [Solanum commersonii]|uniref:Uncharacterized protein n=1 Tax=Solanum commersonii TaxID=4109 RepID=A0A9J5YHE1_SOLCO|nr:hypothetical protein H5410_031059 [Solanum commersonii]